MARVDLAAQVADDFDGVIEHLAQYEVVEASARIEEAIQAINVLATNPLLGRPARNDTRELIIGRESRGYVALYRYVAEIDTVFVLAIRRRREAGYKFL